MAKIEATPTGDLSDKIVAYRSIDDDLLDPYYLHHSDTTSSVIVSQALTGDNYISWSRSMKIALDVKNKLGFIDGTLPKPPPEDVKPHRQWIRNNKIVLSWILNCVSKEISSSLMFADTAMEVWKDLEERFSQSNAPRIFELRREFVHCLQDQKSVGLYYTKLKSIWEELSNFRPCCKCECKCGGAKELAAFLHSEYVMQFLMGLNETFSQARGQVLLMDPTPPINKVFAMITQEEKQRSIQNDMIGNVDQSSTMALSVGQDQKKFNKKERPTCTHCKMLGHTVDKCYKLHGYPPGYKPRMRGQANVAEGGSQSSDNVAEAVNAMENFSSDQCHQLISILSNRITSAPPAQTKSGEVNMTSFGADPDDPSHDHAPLLLSYFVEKCRKLGVDCEAWFVEDGAVSGICEEVKRLKPDLLVLGSRNLGWFRRIFIGSVSDECSKNCECPVLIVKRKPQPCWEDVPRD